ncbi:putative membrane protein/domain [Methanolobus tindarius DSM 2278]|uniref:Putative membrane protein/domain n=1 Tax=Methanolobus tindarius DSM 2278 TaxID=1090322 RepID=W9DWQ4_METTI|nr:RDD family protein [Methanolobus tindarius]ETA67866.1 putative membrane protein/domain [Methanolobus tindarius DSM 2278]
MYSYCPECEDKNENSATECKNCDHELRIDSSLEPDLSLYAGFGRRAVAFIIDEVLLTLIGFMIIAFIAPIVCDITPPYYELYKDLFNWIDVLFYAIDIVLTLFYFAMMESSAGQATFGKDVMGIIVTDLEGNRISFTKAFMRHISKLITTAFFGIGYLTIIFSKKRQGLYDMIVGTVVVYR